MQKIRTIFFGTPEIAANVLIDIIADERYEVCAVVSQPDKPAGRGRTIQPTPVKQIALDNNISVYQPKKLRKNEKYFNLLRAYNADIFLVIAYGKIVPVEILDMAKHGCINIHGSLLPKYRGAAPIQYALLEGEKTTGATLMYMDETMDTGDMIAMLEIEIDPLETSATLFKKFSQRCGKFAADTIHTQLTQNPKRETQDHDSATYTRMIEKKDGRLDTQDSAQKSFQKWQGYTPWPGLFFTHWNKTIQITSCYPVSHMQNITEDISLETLWREKISSQDQEQLTTLFPEYTDNTLYVIPHKTGSLVILSIKPQGKRNMPVSDWIHGMKK